MPRAGPKKVQKYPDAFKLKAVRLSEMEGVQVRTVALALDIHPFMLSRWRKEVREGVICGPEPRLRSADRRVERELRRLQQVEREYALLKEEHELLKAAIRFSSRRRRGGSH